jgi:hypothetical protein
LKRHGNLDDFTIGRALSVAPHRVAHYALSLLYRNGWTEDEVGLPLPP